MEPVVWEETTDTEGNVYYDNGIRTQWEMPKKGWIQKKTKNGRVYYNNGTKTQWEDPRENAAPNSPVDNERKGNANLRARNTRYANNMNLVREVEGARTKLKGTKKKFAPKKATNLPAPPRVLSITSAERKRNANLRARNTRYANNMNLVREVEGARTKLKGTKKQFGPNNKKKLLPKKIRNEPAPPQVLNKLVNLSRKLQKKPTNRSTLRQLLPIVAALTAVYTSGSMGNTSRLHGRSLGPVRQPFSPARPELWGDSGAFPRGNPAPTPAPTPRPTPTPAPTPRPRRRALPSMHEQMLQSFIDAGTDQETINKLIETWEAEANTRNAELAAAAAKKARQNQRNREVKKQLNNARQGFKRAARNLGR